MKIVSKVFLSIVLATAVLVLFSPFLINISGIGDQLKDYVVGKLSARGNEIISINKIDFGFGTIDVKDIQFISKNEKLNVVVKGIQFDYSLIALLTSPSEPYKAIDKIRLVEPRLILKNIETPAVHDSGDIHKTQDLLSVLNQFENIDQINLQNGRLIWKKESGEYLVLARDLNGWLSSKNLEDLNLKAKGKLFNDQTDRFSLDMSLNLPETDLAMKMELKDLPLSQIQMLKTSDKIVLNDGALNGRIYLTANSFTRDSVKINGYLSAKNVSGSVNSWPVENVNLNSFVEDNKVIIKESSGYFNQDEFSISGQIQSIFNPLLEMDLSIPEFRLKTLEPVLSTAAFNGSKAKLDIHLNSSFKRTFASLGLKSGMFTFNGQPFKNLDIAAIYSGDSLYVRRLNVHLFDYGLKSNGLINLKSKQFSGSVNGHVALGQHILFDKLNESTQDFHFRFNGNLDQPSLAGNWQYLFEQNGDTLLALKGRTKLKDGVFDFSMDRSYEHDFIFSLQVADVFSDPMINFGYVENLPVQLFTSNKIINDFVKNHGIEGILVGKINELSSEISVYPRSQQEDKFIFSANISNLLEANKTFSGQMSFHDFDTKFSVFLGQDKLRGQFGSGGQLSGTVDIDLGRQEQLESDIRFNKFLLQQFKSDKTRFGSGEISGNVKVAGALDNPRFFGRLQGDKFVINEIGYYKFNLDLTSDLHATQLDSVSISLNNSPVMSGNLAIDWDKEQVDGVAYGKNIDTDYIYRTFFEQNEVISGTGNYTLSVRGPFSEPAIKAKVSLTDGVLESIPYDELTVELADSLAPHGDFLNYKNHFVNVEHLVMLNGGQYHFEGRGNFPFYSNGKINLQIQFDGDILSLLPTWEPFFTDGASFATIKLKISGTPDSPVIEEGEAKIDRGELWLASVVDHIEEISGTIRLEQGTKNVNIENFRAVADGNPLIINTVRDVVTADGQKLEPWYFRDLKLDFGVLTLETPQDGVSLQIPELMIEKERGEIAFSGRNENEKFYFAGPVKHPKAYGAITLDNSRITYPFSSKSGRKPTPTEQFLLTIDWDVLARAGADLKYVRSIPSFLGEVETELNVNPGSDGLLFTGILEKDTFRPTGSLSASRGRVDYLDMNFRVENFGLEFNDVEQFPEVSGRAWTTIRDSVGAIPKTIYLELYATDPETGLESNRARWEDFRFRLVSSDPTIGESQEQVLAYLGYSVENIRNKATQVGGAVTENLLIRPLLRPIERTLEQSLGFDLVRFNSNIARNLFYVGLGQDNVNRRNNIISPLAQTTNVPYLLLIQSSEVTLGKYISQNLYLTYTGQLVAVADNEQNNFNINHSFGVEYRFFKNLLLEFEYDREIQDFYHFTTTRNYQEDFKIRLRHSFSF